MSALANAIIKNDISFYYALNKKTHYKNLCTIMKLITELGSTTFSVFISLLCYYLFNHLGHFLILNLVISQIIIHALKRIVNRPRPYRILDGANAIKPPKCKYSLPSGHSSSAMTIALVFSMFFPSLAIVFIALSALVGVSRVFLGCHYPTDVCVGVFISLIVFETIKHFIIL
jgi:undecaprenyl-diphosphatase